MNNRTKLIICGFRNEKMPIRLRTIPSNSERDPKRIIFKQTTIPYRQNIWVRPNIPQQNQY